MIIVQPLTLFWKQIHREFLATPEGKFAWRNNYINYPAWLLTIGAIQSNNSTIIFANDEDACAIRLLLKGNSEW